MKRKSSKTSKSIYHLLGNEISRRADRNSRTERLDINSTIRRIREEQKLSGAALCQRAGDLDPKTLTAVEKGRIKNPSIKTLHSVSRGLGLTVSELFRQAEIPLDRYLYQGSQKGYYQMDFPWLGVKAVSFTPFVRDFFCGKLIISARKRLDYTLLNHRLPLFVSVLVGRFDVLVEDKQMNLKEGQNLFFNGVLRHSFTNPLYRESVMMLVTAPSFI